MGPVRRLGIAMLAGGTALLVAGSLASASGGTSALRNGGILLVGDVGASVQIDPQLAYTSTGWWLESATAANLYRYEGKRLVSEVASRFTVSRDGRTYTFWLRRGFRFSDGAPVTATSFRYAFARAGNRTLNAPSAQFVQDVRSVTAMGNRLVIRLAKRDGSLLARLTLPFFQATSKKLPLGHEVETAYPSAGPYYFSRNEVDRLTSLRRNPYWKRGGRHLDGVDVLWNRDEQSAFPQALDLAPVPAAYAASAADRFGVNKTRFWVKPTSCVRYELLNTVHGVFDGNPALRKAVNWAVDRTAIAEQAGPYAATPWTHILSPVVPGSITANRLQPYSLRPNMAKALKLARGHLRGGRLVLAYRGSASSALPPEAQLVVDALLRLGFEGANIVTRAFSGADIYDFIGVRSSGWDLAVGLGWCSDVPDSAIGIGVPSAKFQRRLSAANRLTGPARNRAFGKLDLQIMRELAPVVPVWVYNNRYLFSSRVDPRSLVYEPTLQNWSIRKLALK